jgi:hypothetical protein
MPVQMIELEEVQMVETSDEALEAIFNGAANAAPHTLVYFLGMCN